MPVPSPELARYQVIVADAGETSGLTLDHALWSPWLALGDRKLLVMGADIGSNVGSLAHFVRCDASYGR